MLVERTDILCLAVCGSLLLNWRQALPCDTGPQGKSPRQWVPRGSFLGPSTISFLFAIPKEGRDSGRPTVRGDSVAPHPPSLPTSYRCCIFDTTRHIRHAPILGSGIVHQVNLPPRSSDRNDPWRQPGQGRPAGRQAPGRNVWRLFQRLGRIRGCRFQPNGFFPLCRST